MLVADHNIPQFQKSIEQRSQIAELEGADATDVVETKHDDAVAQSPQVRPEPRFCITSRANR